MSPSAASTMPGSKTNPASSKSATRMGRAKAYVHRGVDFNEQAATGFSKERGQHCMNRATGCGSAAVRCERAQHFTGEGFDVGVARVFTGRPALEEALQVDPGERIERAPIVFDGRGIHLRLPRRERRTQCREVRVE